MMRLFNIVFLSLFFTLAIGGTDGTIRGQVLDVNGEPLPGVQVFIPETGWGANTDLDGNYIILNVQVGTYEVRASMIGYAEHIQQNTSVLMDGTVWLNIVLQEEAIQGQTVTVSGEKKLVEAGTTSKKITVSQETIEALPIKDISELYSLQSGVVKVEGGMAGAIPDHEAKGLEEVHVRGGRSGEIAYMIDGLYIRNPIYGGIGNGTRLNLFAVEEFDWQPGGFNAEYGDAMSAVSNMHTAFGKNQFRYRFKYETSTVGAMLGNLYDELRGFNDYNLGFGGKLPYAKNLPFIESAYYWVSGQHTDKQSYRVLDFDDVVYTGDLDTDEDNNVTPWDTQAGLRGFGFDKTTDVFGKLTFNMFDNKLRLNYSYWQVAAHRKGFSTRYLYSDIGQNELFRDTYRHTLELNHTLSNKTFYTVRISSFIQDQFLGTRWEDSDGDGYPDWFEYANAAGVPDYEFDMFVDEMSSNPNNQYVTPFDPNTTADPTQVYYTNSDGTGPNNWTSGWYYGAAPGNYNWETAEQFIDVNQDGVYTEYFDMNGNGERDFNEPLVDIFLHEHFTDLNGNNSWDPNEDFYDYNGNGIWDNFVDEDGTHLHDADGNGAWKKPTKVYDAIYRDGSYWLTPEMYVDYAKFTDDYYYWSELQSPYSGYVGDTDGNFWEESYFRGWEENSVFGGTDQFYSTSRAKTNEVRFDLTSQISDKWRTRVGTDLKIHKLNFYEIKNPWLDGGAVRQRFAEYWDDVGIDGIAYVDDVADNFEPDLGEGDGTWTCNESGTNCEPYFDFNGDDKWNDYVEPREVAFYWQNTFEVPWMVVNAGVRIDGVHYKTQVWGDENGNYSPYKPWMWRDCGEDGLCPDDANYPGNSTPGYNPAVEDPTQGDGEYQGYEEVTDLIGLPYTEVFFTDAKWLWKISPRLGFSHVITDQATFTFNYGLYYQTPVYQNVYLNTNRLNDPQETFEESEGQLGNATMTSQRTQSYEFGFNIQVNRNWAFSLMGWVKDMDQLVTARTYRSGIYEYQVAANGDYGTATGIDFTLENRGLLINTMLQYTYSVARANGAYDAAAFGNQFVDAPSMEYLMPFDRTHDLSLALYTRLPFGITASMTHFYQSGFPYTPMIFSGDKPVYDMLNENTRRSGDWYWANLSFSKYLEFNDFKMTMGLNVYNIFDKCTFSDDDKCYGNEVIIHDLTGNAHDPGEYYSETIGQSDGVSGAYYDRPWYYQSPAEINFFMRIDFN